jgi:pyruvate dehydrogenase E2 component (dihydrolipoamide acetyltransferase)
LLYIGVEEGSAVPVDAVIAVLGKEGEDYKAAFRRRNGGATSLKKRRKTC